MNDRDTRHAPIDAADGLKDAGGLLATKPTFVHCRPGRGQLIKYFHRSVYDKIVVMRVVGNRRFCGWKGNWGMRPSALCAKRYDAVQFSLKMYDHAGRRSMYTGPVYNLIVHRKIMRTDLKKDKEASEGSRRERRENHGIRGNREYHGNFFISRC